MTPVGNAILLVAALLGAGMGASACGASYPTTATRAIPTAALEVQFTSGSLGAVSPRTSVFLRAYTIDADGAYEDVSTKATWFSSDPRVATVTIGLVAIVNTLAVGTADIFATYQGFTSFVTIPVITSDTVPRIDVRISGTFPFLVGQVFAAEAFLQRSGSPAQPVTATWTSSNPSVLAASNGQITVVAPGTAVITAAAQGLIGVYQISVPPREHR